MFDTSEILKRYYLPFIAQALGSDGHDLTHLHLYMWRCQSVRAVSVEYFKLTSALG